MSNKSVLQEGIYYSPSDTPRNSFLIAFLRATPPYDSVKIRIALTELWKMYRKLQEGYKSSISFTTRDSPREAFSVLMAYGPKYFEITGLRRRKPVYLHDEWLFQQPDLANNPILPNVGLKYAPGVISNEVANDHVAIQFIGSTQFITHRAIVETWKLLSNTFSNGPPPLVLRSFYTGFNRPDGRGWLGFHDGVSNIKSTDRLKKVQIDKKDLSDADLWTANGTYMAFLRIVIDLELWEKIKVGDQERIVGRSKETGCPLSGVGSQGKNVFTVGCPVQGTSDITKKGNERFRDYIPGQNATLRKRSLRGIENSHVQRMRGSKDRIFRQGFEFLEATDKYPFFRAGLNFVSFQGGTDRIYRTIKDGFRKTNFGGDQDSFVIGAEKLLLVYHAGLFLVPPFERGEAFPGETMFRKETMSPYDIRFSSRIKLS